MPLAVPVVIDLASTGTKAATVVCIQVVVGLIHAGRRIVIIGTPLVVREGLRTEVPTATSTEREQNDQKHARCDELTHV